MTTPYHLRHAHELLDAIADGEPAGQEDVEYLRSFLPEKPRQKTLHEITEEVKNLWGETVSNTWPEDTHGEVSQWLWELHAQLKGLKGASATVPALPAGMRLADHENFGRVVVSPGVGIDKCHEIFYLEPGMKFATGISEVEPDSLTFIDTEPTKPAHPEFLKTVEDYENAPTGTIVANDNLATAWVNTIEGWSSTDDGMPVNCPPAPVARRVLRLGWGK